MTPVEMLTCMGSSSSGASAEGPPLPCHIGDKVSSWRRQKNGLPQGSVLAPTLFNLHTKDFFYHEVSQVHLCWWHLLCNTSHYLHRSWEHLDNWLRHSSNLPWKSAVDKMLHNIDNHHNWPVQADVFCYPSRRLSSRHPIWSDLSSVDMNSQWKEDWQSASVTNCAIVEDPTSRQPGFDLPRCSWSLLNRFLTCHAKPPCTSGGWQSHQSAYVETIPWIIS